jgi:hypothetical protein
MVVLPKDYFQDGLIKQMIASTTFPMTIAVTDLMMVMPITAMMDQ